MRIAGFVVMGGLLLVEVEMRSVPLQKFNLTQKVSISIVGTCEKWRANSIWVRMCDLAEIGA